MQTYAYGAVFEAGENGGIVVSFPDVPEAITQGEDDADARAMASEALGIALLTYLAQSRPLPKPRRRSGLVNVAVEPEVAAKIAVLEGFRESGLSKTELARRLGKDEKEIRRILDPDHPTKLGPLKAALAAVGRRMVIGFERAA